LRKATDPFKPERTRRMTQSVSRMSNHDCIRSFGNQTSVCMKSVYCMKSVIATTVLPYTEAVPEYLKINCYDVWRLFICRIS